MKRINTKTHYDYSKLFDAVIDREKSGSETVGRDESGNLILHVSGTYNMGNTISAADEYYIITAEEFQHYAEKARKNRLITWFEYHRFLKEKLPTENKGGRIESFEIITLHTSGMRFTCDHEIISQGTYAEVSEYTIRYTGSENKRILEKRAVVSEKTVLDLLNNCMLLSWDGFHGAHPRGVLDGTMFTLDAVVNEGRRIRADGSENFPKHYRDFKDGLYKMLNGENT